MIERERDLRGWWTGAMAAVVLLWTCSLVARPTLFAVPDDRPFAWIDFLTSHRAVEDAESIAVVAFFVAYVAAILHVTGALAYRASRVTPIASAGVVTLAAAVMVPTGAAYVNGMRDFPEAHMTWWPPVLLGSGVVMAIAGAMSWRVAIVDRRRALPKSSAAHMFRGKC